jgi:hypothetical protein
MILVFAAALAGGCSSSKIEGYGLTAENLVVVTGGKVHLCPLAPSNFVGTEDYAQNPLCEELMPAAKLRGGWWLDERSLIFREQQNRALNKPECRSNDCTDVVSFDLTTRERETAAVETPVRFARTGGDWVVWVDLRNDRNGQCRWPAGDEDCAVDLYGFNRKTKTEHRLTTSSTVFPPGGWSGFDSFAIDGGWVVYVEAGDPSCALLGLDNFNMRCRSTVRALELATMNERVLSRPDRSAMRVRAGNGGVAWFEVFGDSTFELMHARIAGGEVTALGAMPFELNFEVDRDWVVYQAIAGERSPIEATNVVSGEHRVLTAAGEDGVGPVTRNGRVLWIDTEYESISLYELESGARSVLLEGR